MKKMNLQACYTTFLNHVMFAQNRGLLMSRFTYKVVLFELYKHDLVVTNALVDITSTTCKSYTCDTCALEGQNFVFIQTTLTFADRQCRYACPLWCFFLVFIHRRVKGGLFSVEENHHTKAEWGTRNFC